MDSNLINDVIDRYAPRLIQMDGVLGVYAGEGKDHQPAIVILVRSLEVEIVGGLPDILEGFRVVIETSGKITPMGN